MIGSIAATVVFLLLAGLIGYKLSRGRSLKSPLPGTPAAAPAAATSAEAKSSKSIDGWKWGRRGVILAIIAWCAYSIDQEVGFPGTWVANKTYKKSVWIEIDEKLTPVKICKKLPAGTWKFSMPDVENYDRLIAQERNSKKQRQLLEDSPYRRLVQVGDAQPAHFALADGMLINETVRGETFEISTDGCAIITPRFVEYGRVPINLVDNRGSMAVRILFEKKG